MSEQIQAGDMVIVVRGCPCCGKRGEVGHIYRVDHLYVSSNLGSNCCNGRIGATVAAPSSYDTGWDITLLKKIPPLSELGDVEHNEEITA